MANVSRKLIRALESGNGSEASAALRAAVDAGSAAAPELIEAVMKRCTSDDALLSQNLSAWIVAAAPASNAVFQRTWSRLRASRQDVLELFKGLPEQRGLIESQILEFLWEIGVKAAQPYRPEFLRALGEFGSRACQSELAELLDDYKAHAGLKDTTLRSLPKPEGITFEAVPALLVGAELRAIEEARDLCAHALRQIALRDSVHPQFVAAETRSVSRSATIHLLQARELAESAQPGRALNALRHHLEAICAELLSQWNVELPEKKSRQNLGAVLVALTPKLEERDKVLFSQMCGVNKLTDFGSHHSEDFLDKLTAVDVNLVLSLSERVHERFRQL